MSVSNNYQFKKQILEKNNIGDMMKKNKETKVSYFDYIQTGALEKEIAQEFYFDLVQFRKYQKKKKKNPEK